MNRLTLVLVGILLLAPAAAALAQDVVDRLVGREVERAEVLRHVRAVAALALEAVAETAVLDQLRVALGDAPGDADHTGDVADLLNGQADNPVVDLQTVAVCTEFLGQGVEIRAQNELDIRCLKGEIQVLGEAVESVEDP